MSQSRWTSNELFGAAADCAAALCTNPVYTSNARSIGLAPLKNITLSADEHLIESARERARAEHTTLNEQFRRWLADYAQTRVRMQRYDDVVGSLRGQLKLGRKLTRDQMNER